MSYTRVYLNQLHHHAFNSIEHQKVTQDLIDKLFNNGSLTLAEEYYACRTLNVSISENPDVSIKPSDLKSCNNYWFRDRYIVYFRDVSCIGTFKDAYGNISEEQQSKDRKFLQEQYEDWQILIESKVKDEIMQHLSKEVFRHINFMLAYARRTSLGYFRREYLKKVITLHSKFIYLKVAEYYQELGRRQDEIPIFNDTILIDSYAYVHILFRHFAGLLKEYQLDKTYHYDENIDFNAIPSYISYILNQFTASTTVNQFNRRSINYILNGKTYSMWFKPFQMHRRGIANISYLRLQTHYPVGLQRDKDRLANLKQVQVNPSLTFLV